MRHQAAAIVAALRDPPTDGTVRDTISVEETVTFRREGVGIAPNHRLLILFLLFGLLLAIFVNPRPQRPDVQDLRWDEFRREVVAGRVASAEITGEDITATTAAQKTITTTVDDADKATVLLQEHGVKVEFVPPKARPWWIGLLSSLVPGLLMVGLLFFMMRSGPAGGGQVFQFGRSRAKLFKQGERQVTMADVAGVPEAKEDLMEVVDFLRHPDRYAELGARTPKGVLLSGPPGTGKTLLARAVAGESGVPFFSLSGSEFVELFAGVGAARVRDLFERAKTSAPCIIFIDEIDAVGRHRGVGIGGGNDEREQTLNQLLVEMDGFQSDVGVIIIAATNRPDVLDPALLRPGRFDRVVYVDAPDRQGRAEILAVHAKGKKLAPDVDLDRVAAITVGFSGADLANLLNEGALLAARRRHPLIEQLDIEDSFERILTGGPEKKRLVSPHERERVAFHEAGHALVSRFLEHSMPIHKVTIVPRGRAGGYVMFRPEDDKHMHSKIEILDRLAGMLAGRAAEEVTFGDVSSGAANDLQQATDLARAAVTQWGMSEELGPVTLAQDGPHMPAMMHPADRGFSERTASTVDRALRNLTGEAYRRAREMLLRHREGLEKVARTLMERETISGSELLEMLPG